MAGAAAAAVPDLVPIALAAVVVIGFAGGLWLAFRR